MVVASPSVLWGRWKRLAARIVGFQARLLLSVFYFTVVPLFALAVRCGSDPLRLGGHRKPAWSRRSAGGAARLDLASRQS